MIKTTTKITAITLLMVLYSVVHAQDCCENGSYGDQDHLYIGYADYTDQVITWEAESNIIEQKNKSERHWERVVELSESFIKDIEFYGKVIDQYNKPVANASTKFTGSRHVYASGSGPGTVQTNTQGEFKIIGAKGQSLVINNISKQGYQINSGHQFYPGYSSAPQEIVGRPLVKSWADYTQSNPYIFKAWKIEGYPKIIKSEPSLGQGLIGLKPNGRVYIWDFLKTDQFKKDEKIAWKAYEENPQVLAALPLKSKLKTIVYIQKEKSFEGKVDGDIRVSINYEKDTWQFVMKAIDGGVQLTDDEYLNRAPDSGYQKELIFNGNNKSRSSIHKIIYFNSRNKTVYGYMKLELYPYYRDNSAIDLEYVVNLEQGQNLTVKKKNYDR